MPPPGRLSEEERDGVALRLGSLERVSRGPHEFVASGQCTVIDAGSP